MVPFMPALNPTPTFLAWPELPTQGWRAWWRPRCAVGEEIELAFLDPVLHLAAGAADRLAEIGARNFARLERGDDEAGIGLALGPFGLADHPPVTVPTVECASCEVTEPAGRLSGGGALRLGGRGQLLQRRRYHLGNLIIADPARAILGRRIRA